MNLSIDIVNKLMYIWGWGGLPVSFSEKSDCFQLHQHWMEHLHGLLFWYSEIFNKRTQHKYLFLLSFFSKRETFVIWHGMLGYYSKVWEINSDVNHIIHASWLKWRNATEVICDRNNPLWLKEKFYQTAIRPALLYGTECWAIKRIMPIRWV